jgi:hypothetical protein
MEVHAMTANAGQLIPDFSSTYSPLPSDWQLIFDGDDTRPLFGRPAATLPGNFPEDAVDMLWDRRDGEYELRSRVEGTEVPNNQHYDLTVTWMGHLINDADGQDYYLISNAIPFVEMAEPPVGWKMYVNASVGQPVFEGNVGTLEIDFHVSYQDDQGETTHDLHHWFKIYGNGLQQEL